ncbi:MULTISPECIES: APC family permease [unclassified Microcoleus]|uniref:APC family permease n=1 Tax=unclassified Microcoleus TaxID=2642155 RepID=UPI001DAD72AE|nr:MULTISPECIES: APC family permease [unclassified Microcoleus]MCC3516989.1 APC family permease [Microcoleus sp. PH2017_18_LLB_O_A]MCC3568361.1 APC family permease [Microcoleus sp. PH2017_31_RDM_U_A]MCC3580628.1 APC family permease [Microcoleus sp. PH2017_32_RDM_D_A]MCC3618724.1 APC family permease [Microcoleus sp. PH2017_38_RDM_U_B]
MYTYSRLKRVLLGESLPTSASVHERLSNATGLAVLASDALSSVAYATQETLLVLLLAGSSSLSLSLPISGIIVLLLAIVALSYRQTIKAYPNGGGAYIVARENLGIYPGLIAAASLMIDYILTVTVSISAGIAALTSAVPSLLPYTVELCLVCIVLIMFANLRGLRESGKIFMVPTYAFIVGIFILIGSGLFQQATGHVLPALENIPAKEPLGLFLIARAFAAGCTALTGVEAISDGVLAFKPPEWKNARLTLTYLGVILGFMFLGISYLAHIYQVIPKENETLLSVLGKDIFGVGIFYYYLQAATLLILLLAANTSYADFPRLCYFLARDGFLPRQLSLLGDRLVYSNGINLLSICAAVLIVIFRGDTTAVIPLYAVGVFTSFTLSQSGMVIHWFKERGKGWQASAAMNGIGAVATTGVLAVIIATKFLLGAWVVVVTIPIVVSLFLAIHRHYRYVAARLSIQGIEPISYPPRPKVKLVKHPAVVLVGQLHRGTFDALDYARLIADEVVAVHVDIGLTDRAKLQAAWQDLQSDIPLEILESPYRSVGEALTHFLTLFEEQRPGVFLTLIIPAFVTINWWEGLLHNQTAFFLKAALLAKKSRVVTTVRYYL